MPKQTNYNVGIYVRLSIEYITVDEYASDRPRDIHIYYKLLEKPLPHKKFLVMNEDGKTAV